MSISTTLSAKSGDVDYTITGLDATTLGVYDWYHILFKINNVVVGERTTSPTTSLSGRFHLPESVIDTTYTVFVLAYGEGKKDSALLYSGSFELTSNWVKLPLWDWSATASTYSSQRSTPEDRAYFESHAIQGYGITQYEDDDTPPHDNFKATIWDDMLELAKWSMESAYGTWRVTEYGQSYNEAQASSGSDITAKTFNSLVDNIYGRDFPWKSDSSFNPYLKRTHVAGRANIVIKDHHVVPFYIDGVKLTSPDYIYASFFKNNNEHPITDRLNSWIRSLNNYNDSLFYTNQFLTSFDLWSTQDKPAYPSQRLNQFDSIILKIPPAELFQTKCWFDATALIILNLKHSIYIEKNTIDSPIYFKLPYKATVGLGLGVFSGTIRLLTVRGESAYAPSCKLISKLVVPVRINGQLMSGFNLPWITLNPSFRIKGNTTTSYSTIITPNSQYVVPLIVAILGDQSELFYKELTNINLLTDSFLEAFLHMHIFTLKSEEYLTNTLLLKSSIRRAALSINESYYNLVDLKRIKSFNLKYTYYAKYSFSINYITVGIYNLIKNFATQYNSQILFRLAGIRNTRYDSSFNYGIAFNLSDFNSLKLNYFNKLNFIHINDLYNINIYSLVNNNVIKKYNCVNDLQNFNLRSLDTQVERFYLNQFKLLDIKVASLYSDIIFHNHSYVYVNLLHMLNLYNFVSNNYKIKIDYNSLIINGLVNRFSFNYINTLTIQTFSLQFLHLILSNNYHNNINYFTLQLNKATAFIVGSYQGYLNIKASYLNHILLHSYNQFNCSEKINIYKLQHSLTKTMLNYSSNLNYYSLLLHNVLSSQAGRFNTITIINNLILENIINNYFGSYIHISKLDCITLNESNIEDIRIYNKNNIINTIILAHNIQISNSVFNQKNNYIAISLVNYLIHYIIKNLLKTQLDTIELTNYNNYLIGRYSETNYNKQVLLSHYNLLLLNKIKSSTNFNFSNLTYYMTNYLNNYNTLSILFIKELKRHKYSRNKQYTIKTNFLFAIPNLIHSLNQDVNYELNIFYQLLFNSHYNLSKSRDYNNQILLTYFYPKNCNCKLQSLLINVDSMLEAERLDWLFPILIDEAERIWQVRQLYDTNQTQQVLFIY